MVKLLIKSAWVSNCTMVEFAKMAALATLAAVAEAEGAGNRNLLILQWRATFRRAAARQQVRVASAARATV